MTAEEDLLALEDRVLAAAAGGWIQAIDRIRTLLALKDPGIREAVFALIAPDVDRAALLGVAEAFGLGQADALRIVRQGSTEARRPGSSFMGDLRGRLATVIPESSRVAVLGLSGSAAEALSQAKALLVGGIDIQTSLAPLFASRNHVKSSIEWAITDASNAASEDVAISAGLEVVWIAERNACVHCLAYSGQHRTGDDDFPDDLTFGAAPLKRTGLGALKRPPLHPHCRCRLEPLNALAYANALQREARRSILRGIALDSESQTVRLDAAARLLDSGFTDAPASVISFARRSIRNGGFPASAVA